MKHTHMNVWGKPCKCTPGRNAEWPHDKKWQEVLGSWDVEAAKIDWLRSREDMQEPKHQQLLDGLERKFPDHDKLYPWLVREYKKGRLFPAKEGQHDTDFYQYHDKENRKALLTPENLDMLNDYVDYQKAASRQNKDHKGINLDQHEIGNVLHAAQQWDGGGEIVHTFGEDESEPTQNGTVSEHYPGWTIRRLRNKRDMEQEGRKMNHCVGSNGMPYIGKNDNGTGLYYSLRDPHNDPHATLELDSDVEQGTPKWFDSQGKIRNPRAYHPETGSVEVPDFENDEKGVPTMEHPIHGTLKQFPYKHRPGYHKTPTADLWSPSQLFGENDHHLDHHHEMLVNEWLGKHGHNYVYSDGADPEEEFEPWWDSYYTMEGPDTADSYLNYHHGDHYEDAPDEWQRAHSDATEHELDPPELEVESPDWESIVGDMARSPDPNKIHAVWKAAKDDGYLDDLHDHANEWLDNEYRPYLDPYGTGEQGAGANYPEDYEDDKYAALNFMHHMEKNRDPQTGEISDTRPRGMDSLGDTPAEQQQTNVFDDYAFPQWQDKMYKHQDEERAKGVDLDQQQYDAEKRTRLFMPNIHYRGLDGFDATHPDFVDQREKFYELRDQNQQWKDDALNRDERFRQENPQAPQLHTYIDRYKQAVLKSELPPHLFPPKSYQYVDDHDVHPAQVPMWEGPMGVPSAYTGPGQFPGPTIINTQNEQPFAGDPFGVNPRTNWIANTNQGPQILHTNSDTYMPLPDHEWRIPVIHDLREGNTIFGQPGMEHKHMLQNFPQYAHVQNPWAEPKRYHPGFVDTTGKVGEAGLHWFSPQAKYDIPNEPGLHDYVEAKYGVRGTGALPEWMRAEDSDWHE